MHCLLKVLMLLLLLFPPCVIGCSSQVSERDAEKIEAENEAADLAEFGADADGEEEGKDAE